MTQPIKWPPTWPTILSMSPILRQISKVSQTCKHKNNHITGFLSYLQGRITYLHQWSVDQTQPGQQKQFCELTHRWTWPMSNTTLHNNEKRDWMWQNYKISKTGECCTQIHDKKAATTELTSFIITAITSDYVTQTSTSADNRKLHE